MRVLLTFHDRPEIAQPFLVDPSELFPKKLDQIFFDVSSRREREGAGIAQPALLTSRISLDVAISLGPFLEPAGFARFP